MSNGMSGDVLREAIAPEDRIWAQCRGKRARLESDPGYTVFMEGRGRAEESPEALVNLALEITERAGIETENGLVLYNAEYLEDVQRFILENPHYDYIHTTPMGYCLRKLDLFARRPWGCLGQEVSYIFWNLATVQLVEQTKSSEVVLLGSPENQISALWMLEAHSLIGNPFPQTFRLCHDGKEVQVNKEDLGRFANDELLIWLRSLRGHVSRRDCRYPPQAMAEHPLCGKGGTETALSEEAFYELRRIYVKKMEGLWPAFSGFLKPKETAPLVFFTPVCEPA